MLKKLPHLWRRKIGWVGRVTPKPVRWPARRHLEARGRWDHPWRRRWHARQPARRHLKAWGWRHPWRQRAGRAGDRGRLASVSDTSHLNTLKYNKSTNTLFQAQARGPTYYLRTRVQAKPRRTAFGHGRDGVRSPTKYWSVGVARGRFTRRTGRLHPRA